MLLFESYRNTLSICEEYGIRDFKINKDNTVSVRGDVDLCNRNLSKIPLNFGIVSGSFNCSFNFLTSLKGSPRRCHSFLCNNNKLTSLEHAPKVIDAFICRYNKLTSLKGCPSRLYAFDCSSNQLESLEGGPKEVISYNCSNNNLTSLKWAPKDLNYIYFDNNKITTFKDGPDEIGGFRMKGNPIDQIFGLFSDIYDDEETSNYKLLKKILDDYSIIRGNNIVLSRLKDALIDNDIPLEYIPKKIEGYNYI